jgi:hypothetical protein
MRKRIMKLLLNITFFLLRLDGGGDKNKKAHEFTHVPGINAKVF